MLTSACSAGQVIQVLASFAQCEQACSLKQCRQGRPAVGWCASKQPAWCSQGSTQLLRQCTPAVLSGANSGNKLIVNTTATRDFRCSCSGSSQSGWCLQTSMRRHFRTSAVSAFGRVKLTASLFSSPLELIPVTEAGLSGLPECQAGRQQVVISRFSSRQARRV